MDQQEEEEVKTGSKAPILIAVALASVLGSVAFAAMFSGILTSSGEDHANEEVSDEPADQVETKGVEFVALEPLLVSLGASAAGRQLRFEGYLEINPEHMEEIQQLMPRVMDVLNTYLRAVSYDDIQEPSALLTLRLQMLRRVQIVVGEGRVNDLLVSKFLLT